MGALVRGLVVYRGPSLLDGAPIVAVLTRRSANSKTGNMPQLWILRSDVDPLRALEQGADRSICGDCPHRGDGHGKRRSCYVVVERAPLAVYKAFRRGIYPPATDRSLRKLTAGRVVRLGAYGDVAALPRAVVDRIVEHAAGWTGYTHQWRQGFALADLVMASCDSDADSRDAAQLGYRSFRVVPEGAPRMPGHLRCPASAERGHATTCARCRQCDGTRNNPGRPSVQIAIHGNGRRFGLPVLA
jgi:hypothetical protein